MENKIKSNNRKKYRNKKLDTTIINKLRKKNIRTKTKEFKNV